MEVLNMSTNKNDICVEFTHGRKGKNKTEFKGVVSKIVLSALVMSVAIGGLSVDAYATEINNTNVNTGIIYSENYMSVKDAVSALRNTIEAIEYLKSEGMVTDESLQSLAVCVNSLQKVANEGTTEIKGLLDRAEKAIKDVKSSQTTTVQVSIDLARDSLFGTVIEVKNTQAAVTEKITSFSDVPQTHWAYKSIMTMTNQGLFSGTGQVVAGVGQFSPDNVLSRSQFITVVVRALYGDELNSRTSSDGVWWSNAYNIAIEKGLIKSNEFSRDTLDKGMPRQEMALVLVRAAEQLGQTPSQLINTSQIPDYSTVGTYYRDYVVKAYSMGMLAGTNTQGTFNPQGTLTRAQGSVTLNRLVDSSTRIDVDLHKATAPPVAEVGQTQTWTVGQNHSEPKVGDTVIKADGTKIVLKSGIGGVLGAGQGVDIYTGTVVNGVTAKEGMGSWFDGRVFYKDTITGEMYTATQWNTIAGATHPGVKGSSNGEVRNTWWEYDTADEIWYWVGPAYH